MMSGHVGQPGESVFEHKGLSAQLGRHRDGDGGAQRTAHHHDFVRLDAHPLGEPALGGDAVGNAAGFVRPAFAVAVAAVVEQKDRCLERVAQAGGEVGVDGDELAVAVAVDDRPIGRRMAHEPAVELRAVGRGEPHVLVIEPRRLPVAGRQRRRRVHEPGFEKRHTDHQHEIAAKDQPHEAPHGPHEAPGRGRVRGVRWGWIHH